MLAVSYTHHQIEICESSSSCSLYLGRESVYHVDFINRPNVSVTVWMTHIYIYTDQNLLGISRKIAHPVGTSSILASTWSIPLLFKVGFFVNTRGAVSCYCYVLDTLKQVTEQCERSADSFPVSTHESLLGNAHVKVVMVTHSEQHINSSII